jgi:hypothetical protein
VVDRIRAVPAWIWLVALVACSTVVRFGFARHMVGPWIMIDEIVYSELAKSFASSGHFAVREAPTTGYGFVYPVLISPAYALFRDIPTVYTGIKVINSLLMSLAAVPAYLIARRVVSPGYALVVALLTVAVPSTFYAGTVMTENAFYPIFILAVLALLVALERPLWWTVLLFLAGLLLAYETRAQAVALLPAALTAPLLLAALNRRWRDVLGHRLLYLIAGGLAVLAVLAEVVRGRSVRSLLGAYSAATHSSYGVRDVARWLLWHLSELELYVGIVPVLALILLCVDARRLTNAQRVLVGTTVSVVAWFAVEVAAFASQPSVLRIEERNLFYVAPLLFACLLLWIERGLPRGRIALPIAGAAVVVLAAAVPYERFIDTSATSDTFGVLTLWSVAEWTNTHAEDIRWLVTILAIVLVLLAAFIRRRWALVLPAIVFGLYLVAVQPVDSRTQRASIGAVFQGITKPDRDWITAAVRSTDPKLVSVVWTGATDRLTVNQNEFFNRAVGDIYTTNGPVPGGLAQTPVTFDRRTGRFLAEGKVVRVRDLLGDTSLSWYGHLIAHDAKKGLVLLRVNGPLRVHDETTGIDADSWSGATATYKRYDCTGGVLRVRLGSDPHLFTSAQRVRAYQGGKLLGSAKVLPDAVATMRLRLQKPCAVRFHVLRTKVPGNGDTRHLGVRFLGFDFE